MKEYVTKDDLNELQENIEELIKGLVHTIGRIESSKPTNAEKELLYVKGKLEVYELLGKNLGYTSRLISEVKND